MWWYPGRLHGMPSECQFNNGCSCLWHGYVLLTCEVSLLKLPQEVKIDQNRTSLMINENNPVVKESSMGMRLNVALLTVMIKQTSRRSSLWKILFNHTFLFSVRIQRKIIHTELFSQMLS